MRLDARQRVAAGEEQEARMSCRGRRARRGRGTQAIDPAGVFDRGRKTSARARERASGCPAICSIKWEEALCRSSLGSIVHAAP